MNVTIIISYRELDNYRKKNLDLVIQYLQIVLDKAEIIVVEQDEVSKFENKYAIKHIFLPNYGEFNKSMCYNVGARMATNENLLFHDADCILDMHNYFLSLKKMEEGVQIINPYKDIYFLDEHYTEWFCKFNLDFSKLGLFNTRPVTNGVISGGVFFIKKETYYELGGFEEKCVGYGYEDSIFDIKIRSLGYKVLTNKENMVHLWHPKLNSTKNNKELFDHYRCMSVEDIKRIIEEGDF